MKKVLVCCYIFCCIIGCVSFFSGKIMAQESVVVSEFIFKGDAVICGGKGKLIGQNEAGSTIESSGEHWVSLPFQIAEDGFYAVSISQTGGGEWDILIDGERFKKLSNFSFGAEGAGENVFFLRIAQGQHSILFDSRASFPGIYRWNLVRIRKIIEPPGAYIDARSSWVALNGYSQMLKIGDMFSGNYINVNIARDMALFSRGGYQYISYYNSEGYLMIGRRRLGKEYFEKYRIPIAAGKAPLFKNSKVDFSLDDPHHFISMQMDGLGYIHVAFGQHKSTLKYIRSSYPYEISSWNTPEKAMENVDEEKQATYVQFVKLHSGNLLALFRVGIAGKGYCRLLSYDVKTQVWTRLYSPFITDFGYSSPYFWRPVVTEDGVVHLLWTWRLSVFNTQEAWYMLSKYFNGFSNKDICYAKSIDEGKSWKRSDGRAYKLPIQRRALNEHKAEIVAYVNPGESFFNHYGSDGDSKMRPHFTYTKWNDTVKRIPQQWHLYWNGSVWRNDPVTKYKRAFSWTKAQQEGLASTFLARPSMVVSHKDTALILSRSKEKNNMLELYVASGPEYKNWVSLIGYSGALGGWEPQMDLDQWKKDDILNVLILGITDKHQKKFQVRKNLRDRISRLMKNWRFFFELALKNKPAGTLEYYSDNIRIEELEVDKRLEENTGYILEITYSKMKEALKIMQLQ